jgi:hypothetical protein
MAKLKRDGRSFISQKIFFQLKAGLPLREELSWGFSLIQLADQVYLCNTLHDRMEYDYFFT